MPDGMISPREQPPIRLQRGSGVDREPAPPGQGQVAPYEAGDALHDCEARCTRQHVPPDGTPFGAGFESVRIMRLQIDDVIVIEVDYPVTAKDIDAFKARIEATFPGHKAIVLDNGARLSIARPDADLGSVKPNPETAKDSDQ
jgi:hypothetical protein